MSFSSVASTATTLVGPSVAHSPHPHSQSHGHPSISRGLPSNPGQAIRRLPPASAVPPMPPPPIPEKYHASHGSHVSHASHPSAGSTLSAHAPSLSAHQVISLARDAMSTALQDNESQAAEASAVSNELKPGVTIDLSRKNIQELPDEVVDIIKHELERLALSHNKLSTFPARFSECTTLRYLNVRNNLIKEFPLPLCHLKSLEILDLGRNRIRVLPPDIAKLTSLKVLAVQKNRIEELPMCLADMVSLQVLKLDGNNISFPPREVLQYQAQSPPNESWMKENEVTEVAVTAHIKRYLRQYSQSMNGRDRDLENAADDFSEGTETPRMPAKRVISGRFPVRVNGNDMSDPRSPAIPRAPAFPSRSHSRGSSAQTLFPRRPSVMPLTIGNPNERVRSNSETLFNGHKLDRPSERHKRMAIVSKRANDLGTLDETEANNRFSHYRGMSDVSSLTGMHNPSSTVVISPASPVDPLLSRPNYVRRLSVLPEQRRESKVFDPIVESAKGILYSIFQIHPMIQLFTRLTSDGTAKRSSLERVFYNTNGHVEQLEQEIQKHELNLESGNPVRENGNIQRAVLTLVSAYSHICTLLTNNMDNIVDNGDPRYIRSMLMLLYNSIMELRVTANETSMGIAGRGPNYGLRRPGIEDTIKPHSREGSIAPMADRLGPGSQRGRPSPYIHNPSNLRVATDTAQLPQVNGHGRTATVTSATPRSGESFASLSADGRNAEPTQEDRAFDQIFLSLQKSSDLVMRILPTLNVQLGQGKRAAENGRAPDHVISCWVGVVSKCGYAIKETEILKSRLSRIKLKETGVRTDPGFWSLCKTFINAWADFGSQFRNTVEQISAPLDARARLRPIQNSIKETNKLISDSPWAPLFEQAGSLAREQYNHFSPGHYATNSAASQGHPPMTPQSAALGPAAQAIIPSTPQSASFAHAFSGGVFERADALMSMGGLSMSRTGTMSSATSASSATVGHDERHGYSSSLSPNMHPGQFRFNGGGIRPSF